MDCLQAGFLLFGACAVAVVQKALSGGVGARAAQGILSAANLGAATEFASREAALREQRRQAAMSRVGAYAGQVQAIDNANVQANIMAQRDLNAAIGQQRENIGRAYSSFGNLGSMALGYGLNSFSTPTTPTTTTTPGTVASVQSSVPSIGNMYGAPSYYGQPVFSGYKPTVGTPFTPTPSSGYMSIYGPKIPKVK